MIIGHTGMIGMEQITQLIPHYRIIGISRSRVQFKHKDLIQINYGNMQEVEARIRLETKSVDFIINNLAISDFSKFQTDPDEYYDFNIRAANFGAYLARSFNSYLIYTSSDSVYEGNLGAHKFNEKVNLLPNSYYGKSKLESEIISRRNKFTLVTRGNFYGESPNSRKGIIERIKLDKTYLRNQLSRENYLYSPLCVQDYVHYQLKLIKWKSVETVNICSRDSITRADFIKRYLAKINLESPNAYKSYFKEESVNLSLDPGLLEKILDIKAKSVNESMDRFLK